MNILVQKFTFYIVHIILMFSFYITNGQVKLSESDTMNMKVKDSIKSAYRTLTDSTEQYDFGTRCYYTGVPPKGRIAINTLRSTNHIDLIRKVLNGHNNEGKVYVIEAMLKMNLNGECHLSVMDKKEIKIIIREDFDVNRCEGGIVSTISTVELFRDEAFKNLLEENEIYL